MNSSARSICVVSSSGFGAIFREWRKSRISCRSIRSSINLGSASPRSASGIPRCMAVNSRSPAVMAVPLILATIRVGSFVEQNVINCKKIANPVTPIDRSFGRVAREIDILAGCWRPAAGWFLAILRIRGYFSETSANSSSNASTGSPTTLLRLPSTRSTNRLPAPCRA